MAFSNHDVRPDTPINNFATWNPLFAVSSPLYEGNLYAYGTTSGARSAFSTFEIPTTGKWYVEILSKDNQYPQAGIGRKEATGSGSDTACYGYYDNDTSNSPYALYDGASGSAATTLKDGFNLTSNSITRIYIDADKNQMWMGKDTTWATGDNTLGSVPTFGSGGTYNGSTPLNFADGYHIFVSNGNGSDKWFLNAGQDSTFGGNKIPTKVYTDSNGQGRFYYEPPVGALALCSRNIDTPKNVPSTYIVDETNNNILSYNGNTEISKFSPYEADGYSMKFDGSNQRITLPSNTSYAIGASDDYSVECWVYIMEMENVAFFQTATSTSGANGEFWFGVNSNNLIASQHGSGTYLARGSTSLSSNRWYHVAAKRVSGTLSLFVNGVQETFAAGSNHSAHGSTSFTQAGASIGFQTTNAYLNGYITDLKFNVGGVSGTAGTYSSPLTKTSIVSDITNTKLFISNAGKFKDTSGTAATPTLVNNPSIEAWSPYTSINKQTGFELPETTNGGSIKLDGSSGYISTSGDSVDFGTAGTPFTLEAWVYPTTATQGSYAGIVGSYSTAADNTGIDITATNGNNQFYSVHVGSGISSWNQFNSAPKPFQWQHIAVTRDTSGNIRLYLDGVKDSKVNVQQNGNISSSNKQLRIGHFWGNQYYNGYITNVRLSNNVRYVESSGNFTPSAEKFVSDSNTLFLYQPFQPKSSVNSSVFNITDSYNKGEADKNLTYFGNTKVVDFSPYKGGSHGSFSFDGTGDYISIPSLNANIGAGDFTIEFWVYLNDTTAGTFFNSTSGLFYSIRASDDASLLQTNLGGTTTNKASGNVQTSNLNKWVHHAIVRNGTDADNVKIYENGIQSGIGTISDSLSFSQCNLAGMTGYMTDFRIVGSAVYTGAFTPPYDELTAITYTKLLLQPGKVADSDNGAAKDPDAFFKCVAYTGNTTTPRQIDTDGDGTGTGFKPDLVWLICRNQTYENLAFDSIRGAGNRLYLHNDAIQTNNPGTLTEFNSTGFKVGGSSSFDLSVNGASNTYCAWCWKAAGAPTSTDTSVNGSARRITVNGTEDHTSCDALANAAASVGSNHIITPRAMSINQQAGFSIVKYVGNNGSNGHTNANSAAGNQGIPHGLGKYAKFVLIKSLDTANGWVSFIPHPTYGLGHNYHLRLDTTAAGSGNNWTGDNRQGISYIPDTDNVIYVGNDNMVSKQGDNFIMYVFTDIEGYSKFGSYTGTNHQDKGYRYLGFKPAFIMIKDTAASGTGQGWAMFDNQRGPINPIHNCLLANDTAIETTTTTTAAQNQIDFLSNGFFIRCDNTNSKMGNVSGNTYIYMAFAESPFSYARGR